MSQQKILNRTFKLADYEVLPLEYVIIDAQENRKTLQPKFIELLCYLASQYPRLVPRQEIVDVIWDGNKFVGEKALTNAIWHLRKTLVVDSENGGIIETVRKSGYRLNVEPEYAASADLPKDVSRLLASEPETTPFQFTPWLAAMLVTILVLSGWHAWQSHIRQQDVVIENLTSEPGRELFPVVSPDGTQLAYLWRKMQQKSDIFVKDLTQPSQPARQLTFTDGPEYRMVWSADGRSLFYSRENDEETWCELVQLDLRTGEETVLTPCQSGSNVSLSLSADGKRIAYNGPAIEDSFAGIHIYDLDTGRAERRQVNCADPCLFRERDMAFSPTSDQLAVSRRVGEISEDIFLLDANTDEARQLTFGMEDIRGMTWLSDGRHLVFAVQDAGTRSGYILDTVSGKIQPLQVSGFSFPSLDASTNTLLYHDWNIRHHVAYVPTGEGVSAAPFPLMQSEFSHRSADYSEAADRLVYISNESGFYEAWSARLDGTERRQLTQLKTRVFYPRWSHDGSKIVLVATDELQSGNRIYVLDVATAKLKPMATGFKRHYRPSWSASDNEILFSASAEDVVTYQMDIYSQEMSEVVEGGRFTLSGDDSHLFHTIGRGEGLWEIDLDAHSARRNLLSGEEFSPRYNWVPTQDGVFYAHDEPHASILRFWQSDSEQIRDLVRLPSRRLDRFAGFSYVPERQWLLFTVADFPQIDVKRLSHPLLNQ